MEVWKEIPDTDYRVSNEGRVASRKWGDWRILKPRLNGAGYLRVCFRFGGVQSWPSVHSLVLEAFVGPRPTAKHQGNHIDGVRVNNCVTNLEWVTPSGNQRHRHDVLRHGGNFGETNGRAKLTDESVETILERAAKGESQSVIAADFRVCQQQVSRIVSGKRWPAAARARAAKSDALAHEAALKTQHVRGDA